VRILNPFAILALVALSLAPLTVCGQQSDPPQIVGVRVGLGDRYKAGLWTQVEVVLRGGSTEFTGELSLITPDADGVPGRVSTPPNEPCTIRPGQETTVRLITRFGRVQGTLTAELRAGNDLLASRTFDTAAQADAEHFLPAMELRSLIVSIGDSTVGIEDMGKLLGVKPEHRPAVAQLDDLERLPTHWCGYEGVDAVILSTSRPEIYAKLAADSAQMRALNEWIEMGGRLVLCVGAHGNEVMAAESPLRQFVPGRLDRVFSLRQTSALETYCGSRSAMPQTQGVNALRAAWLTDVQGTIEAHESDLPLVIRTVRGFGQIIFLAVDIDQPPLGDWFDRPLLVARLLDLPMNRADESEAIGAMMHFGFNDLAGQLRSALDRFGNVWLVPFWLVAGLSLIYLLLIGPGDYFLLRKLGGRMTWTWLTFPAVVLLVCAGAYMLALSLKGREVRVNQIDLVDVDATSGRLRGASWLNVYSPRMETFNFSMQPQGAKSGPLRDSRTWMAWLGLPGNSLGGMNPRAGGPVMWTDQFRYAPTLDALLDVPIQIWSTKSLTARWTAPKVEPPPAELVDTGQLLTGSITNTFGFPLRNCILAHGVLVYDLGTIQPGDTVRMGLLSKRSELKTLLTGKKFVTADADSNAGENYRLEVTPYDQSSTNLPYILRMMMFYGAVGGHRYTGLWNAYQGFVDLSDLLKGDRAILVAQGPDSPGEDAHGAQLLRDGQALADPQDKHCTMYRFVFPVKKE
jgi:hypothetical protein